MIPIEDMLGIIATEASEAHLLAKAEEAERKRRRAPERDHEFPWIIREGCDLTCERCREKGDLEDWLGFLQLHSLCKGDSK